MLTSEIRNELLVDELQLGTRLNNDIQAQNRADFALMLAMLSQDVRDNPIFATKENPTKKEDLRAKFQLPPAREDYAKQGDFEKAQQMTESFHQDGLTQVFFEDCLQKAPLIPFRHEIAPEVFAQLPPLSQEKIRLKDQGKALAYEALKEKGEGFMVLDEINHGRAMSAVNATA
ncbi:MAG: VC2046/SO_2500 family protein [Succinivibrio sp.]|nr:VC2046/SO_2500 family protein [Succinivibrio sp.]